MAAKDISAARLLGLISSTIRVFPVLFILDQPITLRVRRALANLKILSPNRCFAGPRSEPKTPDHSKKPAPSWAAQMALDRRALPRYRLAASVELVDTSLASGSRRALVIWALGDALFTRIVYSR
jgi:hypothetical protein